MPKGPRVPRKLHYLSDDDPGDAAGVREPRRPKPLTDAGAASIDDSGQSSDPEGSAFSINADP
jgi:hypothetical protein